MPLPSITKGSITVLERGITKNFMFNPNEITDEKGVNYGATEIPGVSHPVYQFGSGGERLISFELHLDGDRGRHGKDTSQGVSIKPEILFWQSLVYPSNYLDTANDSVISQVYPFLVTFSFGTMYNRVQCIVKSVGPIVVNYWTPDLAPVRAKVPIKLAEVVTRSRTSRDVFPDAFIPLIGV